MEMFRLVVSDARVWRAYMAAVGAIVDEATFTASREGLALRAMDPSHVAMVDFSVGPDAFHEYEYRGENPARLCVDVSALLRLLRRVEGGETLELTHDPDHAFLALRLQGRYTRRFSLPLLQPSGGETPTPKIAFTARVRLDSDALQRAVEDIGGVSDQVRFEASEDALTLTGASETGNVAVEFGRLSPAVVDFQVESAPVKALYGVSFLEDMVKAGSSSAKLVSVEFAADKPVKLDFDLHGGKLTYYLAPRLE